MSIRLKEFLSTIKHGPMRHISNGEWVPARPMTRDNTFWSERIVSAWEVLAGKADAVRWPE